MARIQLRVLVGLTGLVLAAQARAGGFQLMEQNASHLGTAYAGASTTADNASTIYYNPAGLSYLPGANLSVGGAVISTHARYNDSGATSGGDAGVTALVPNAYFALGVTPKLSLGMGISSPFGLSTRYDGGWVGQDHGLKTSIRTVNFNPTAAYRLTDQWSLGFGLNYQTIKASMDNNNFGGAAYSKLSGTAASWGWNVGVMYDLSPSMRLGLSYRSAIKHRLEGETNTGTPVMADLKLPSTLTYGVYQQLSDRWEAMADVSRIQWSTVQSFDVFNRNTGARVGLSDPYGYRNTWRVSWGAMYKYTERTKLKFGLAFDQTPTNDRDRSPRLPDANRVWFSLGVQYRPSKAITLDAGYTYVYIKDPQINRTSPYGAPTVTPATLTGSYDASAHILGAQYSHAF